MRFLLDANLPRSVTGLLSAYGHRFEFARDIGLGAAADEQIAAHAQATDAVLLTRDLGFADTRRYPPTQFAGLVVIRLPDDSPAADIVKLIERFLREPQFLVSLRGRLAIVEADRVRFRPPVP